ncbi:MAG: GTP-binding protein [Deltaproteobacteria bacterium]|nr:GTP-binding protein [Deltaproteobacteria bacterium]
MSTVNVSAREVAAKIVYYGPGLSGKTTNLKRIHDSVKPTARGELTALATEGDRTLFFDFLPVKVERINNFALRLGLYTVPGQVFYNATRKLVLQGADGVVFVADSQPDALERNVEALDNLVDNLRDEGIDLAHFPLVIQYNKRDLKRVLAVSELHEALNRFQAPEFEASATEGGGVMDSLKAITRLVIRELKARGVVGGERPISSVQAVNPADVSAARSLESQIRELTEPLHGTGDDMQLVAPIPTPPAPIPAPRPEPARAARPASHHAVGAASARVLSPDLESEEIEDTDPARPSLSRLAPADPPEPDEPEAWEPSERGGTFLTRLAPPSLRAEVAALEASYAAGDHPEVVSSTLRLIRTLAGTDRGEEILGGYLLGMDGRELRRLLDLSSGAPSREDAAFALYLLAQACVRSSTR